jgi:GNAT superfamily N-acetyltransferase
MTPAFHIAPVTVLHPDIEALQLEAAAEGFRFVDKLIKDWLSAANRFDRPGELFLGAFQEGHLAGFCGLNHDHYADREGVGRLRHLYVRQDARRSGIGSVLVKFILDEAKDAFQVVRLRTDTPEAAEFYTKLGFKSVIDTTASHVKLLT